MISDFFFFARRVTSDLMVAQWTLYKTLFILLILCGKPNDTHYNNAQYLPSTTQEEEFYNPYTIQQQYTDNQVYVQQVQQQQYSNQKQLQPLQYSYGCQIVQQQQYYQCNYYIPQYNPYGLNTQQSYQAVIFYFNIL